MNPFELKRLGSYILRQCLGSALISLLVLVGVVLALFFAELMGDAARGRMPGQMMFSLLALRMPEAVLLVGPLALMTGLLMALGRLQQQAELTVMRASGWSVTGLLWPLTGLVFAWGLGLLLISGWVGPHSARMTADLMESADQEALLVGLRPGQFQRLDQGRLSIYVERAGEESGVLEDIFIYRSIDAGRSEVTTASRGRFWVDPGTGDRFLTLFDGRQLNHGRETADLRQLSFARNDIRLPPPVGTVRENDFERMQLLRLARAPGPQAAAEWHWRLASPIAAVVLGLLAVPLSLGAMRQANHGRIVLALALYLAYSNFINLGVLGLEQGRIPSALGLWPIHVLVALLAAVLWHRTGKQW